MLAVEPEQELDFLWREHSKELTRFATLMTSSDDAIDVVADAFIRLEPRLSEVSEARSYLFRTVRTIAIDRGRRDRRRRRRERSVHQRKRPPAAPDTDPAILDAVRQLSPQQRAVTYFAYWEDMTEEQIADVLEISTGSVRRHLARARAHLRRTLT